MSLYIKGINCNDLQSAVQPTQLWATVNGKSNSLVVSAGLLYKLESWQKVPIDVLASQCKQAKSESSFSHCPYVGLQQEVWLRLKVCPTSPGSRTCFVSVWPWTQRSDCLSLLGLKGCITLPGNMLFAGHSASRSPCQDPIQKPVSFSLQIWIWGVPFISWL